MQNPSSTSVVNSAPHGQNGASDLHQSSGVGNVGSMPHTATGLGGIPIPNSSHYPMTNLPNKQNVTGTGILNSQPNSMI